MKRILPLLALIVLNLAACRHYDAVRPKGAAVNEVNHRPDAPAGHHVDFVREVKPLLEARCLECHHWRYVSAGLNLETQELAMKGSRNGAVIVPGAPDRSPLYHVLLLGHESPVAMPPTPERVEGGDRKLLHDWIAQGAHWPVGVQLVPPQDWETERPWPLR